MVLWIDEGRAGRSDSELDEEDGFECGFWLS